MLETLTTVIAPLLGFFIPGIVYPVFLTSENLSFTTARVILWSTSLSILFSLALAFAGLPTLLAPLLFTVLTSLILWQKRSTITNLTTVKTLAIFIVSLVLIATFAIPSFLRLYSLPSGDMQKTILWASSIQQTNKLPNYNSAIANLNRDPVDFYTPGLHTWAASVLSITSYPLLAMSLWAIALAITVTFIAIALAQLVFPKQPPWLITLLTTFLLLTNFRFLRYLNLPGYHVQNLAGELLLFGAIFISLSLIKKYHTADIILLTLLLVALYLTHQFSAFIAAFVMLPIIIIGIYRYARKPKSIIHYIPIILSLLLAIGLALAFNIDDKIFHIFSTNPHLSNYVPNLLDYFSLMGSVWFSLGLSGLVFLLFNIFRAQSSNKLIQLVFLSSSTIILILSQAPLFYIDIPPIRALFYLAVPFSILGAYFISFVWQHTKHQLLIPIILSIIVLVACLGSLTQAYQIPINTPNNSTLTPELLNLSQYIKTGPVGAILIDDYNQRAASWLILSGHPMYTRLASNISRLTNEASQSQLRRNLYLHQLDYEKIFSLASLPAITQLMQENDITYLATTNQLAADSFAANPFLHLAVQTDHTTIFTINDHSYESPISKINTQWLLRTSTLTNDIGDQEDTYQHLPASIQATNLSDPQTNNHITTRQTTSTIIPLRFNVKDYIHTLWDMDNTNLPDTDMQLYVRLTNSPPNLSVRLPDDTELALPKDGILNIPNHSLLIQDGFITIKLLNPTQKPVSIDLIALGPLQTQ